MLEISAKTSALVLIDLQKGIVNLPLAPRSGTEVVSAASGLAQRFRDAGAPVVIVNVGFSADFGDALQQPVDQSFSPPGGYAPDFSEIVEGLASDGDIRITKRQWGAFYGTELDLQLRRRGIKSVVIGGIATNFGVESTARQAYELGYEVVVPEDATATLSPDLQNVSIGAILPQIGRITTVSNVELK
ncbi:hydrolase [Flavisphingomonas formosensis]|uniref:hydrolase n=1 Tax=Flavisphingomonas formosensis TaxID=861534 RepID=UPI0012FA90E5|nr:hydrolase [Sphingomonas formosensis]